MNKLSGVLLLSIMFCGTRVAAHEFSSGTIMSCYNGNKNIKLITQALGKFNLNQLTELENAIVLAQMERQSKTSDEQSVDFSLLQAEVKAKKTKIHLKLGLMALLPFVVGAGYASAGGPGNAVDNLFSAALVASIFEAIPAYLIAKNLVGF